MMIVLTSQLLSALQSNSVSFECLLKNSPAVFQEVVERVLHLVRLHASNYIDDVLVFSNLWSNHLVHLGEVLSCLRDSSLKAKRSKCEFGRKYLLYLGHQVV